MIPYLSAVFLAAGFIGVAKVLQLVPRADAAISTAKTALGVVQSPDLDDDAKEAALQKHAKELFASFFVLTLGAAAAVGLPTAVIWGLERMNVGSVSAAITAALSPTFVVPSSIIIVLALLWTRRKQ
jgi:hypothetical protein